MSLVKCSECQKEISDKASACLNCGNPANSKLNSKEKEKKIKEAIQSFEISKIAFDQKNQILRDYKDSATILYADINKNKVSIYDYLLGIVGQVFIISTTGYLGLVVILIGPYSADVLWVKNILCSAIILSTLSIIVLIKLRLNVSKKTHMFLRGILDIEIEIKNLRSSTVDLDRKGMKIIKDIENL